MKSKLLSILALAALTACSAATVYKINIDMRSYLPAVVTSFTITKGDLPATPSTQQYSQEINLGLPVPSESLQSSEMVLAANFASVGTAGTSSTLKLELRVGAKDDANVFDGVGDYSLITIDQGTLAAGQNKDVQSKVALTDPNTPLFKLLEGGHFKVGVQGTLAGTSDIQVNINKFTLSFKGKPKL